MMQISPDFSPLALALAAPLAAYLLVGEPWLGKRSYDALKRRRDTDPAALTRLFTRWIAGSWTGAALAALILLLSPAVHPADLGLVLPGDLATTAGTVTGLALVIAVTAVLLRALARSGRGVPGQGAFAAILPRTRKERGYALAMSVTAGICEEIVFRGLLIALGVAAGLDVVVAAGAALAVFTLGHLYQGWRGMVPVALIGWSLTYLYLSTGSLLVPIIVHVLVDVRGLVLVPAPTSRPAPEPTPAAAPRFGAVAGDRPVAVPRNA